MVFKKLIRLCEISIMVKSKIIQTYKLINNNLYHLWYIKIYIKISDIQNMRSIIELYLTNVVSCNIRLNMILDCKFISLSLWLSDKKGYQVDVHVLEWVMSGLVRDNVLVHSSSMTRTCTEHNAIPQFFMNCLQIWYRNYDLNYCQNIFI